MKDCLTSDSYAIKQAADNLNEDICNDALLFLNHTYENKGKLLVSGVGKSGIVSRKIAATFTSLGFPSLFLNPTDALHGDLGIAMKNDTVIFLSNSGETRELLELIPYLTHRINKIISITGNNLSTLARKSDVHIESHIDKESCPQNLFPTTSTTLSLAIGDALAAQWSLSKGITQNAFARNHPAGAIGQRLTLTVESLMKKLDDLPSVSITDTIRGVVIAITSKLSNNLGVGFAWVKDNNNKFAGIVTDGDLRRALSKHPTQDWDKIGVSDIYTKKPRTITKDELAIDALEKMENNIPSAINNLAVIDKNYIIGFINMHDILKINSN